ncbi:MAG: ABC transporter substrate-binding protein [Alphaproteobacteria bacterium]|nr:ABC transporter substrate-binding protein [Alphaproteobacteria bacterium]
MRALVVLLGLLVAAPGAARADDPIQYVQRIVAEMVTVSKKPTADRRAFYVGLLTKEVDWTGPAIQALGQRWDRLAEADRARLADWSRDSVLGTDSVMQFIQNLIFQSCAIAGKNAEADGASVRVNCVRFGQDPNFSVRFEVRRQGERIRIVDIGHIGVSLREELSKEILKPSAVSEHGVRVN